MEAVFKALADASRRLLLDQLFLRDGQSLGELEAHLPEMSRFGVMKHLRVLEDAGLITTRRAGREKLHHLNPVPIRLLHDRWISKYAAPLVGTMADLKHTLEQESMNTAQPVLRYELFIGGSPRQVWDAITRPEETAQYFYGTRFEAQALEAGSDYAYYSGEGDSRFAGVTGKVLEADAPNTLLLSWAYHFNPDAAGDASSRLRWTIEPAGERASKLTVVHDGFEGETATYKEMAGGWPLVFSGLKTLVETGAPLAIG